jgi:hypothetical protein
VGRLDRAVAFPTWMLAPSVGPILPAADRESTTGYDFSRLPQKTTTSSRPALEPCRVDHTQVVVDVLPPAVAPSSSPPAPPG